MMAKHLNWCQCPTVNSFAKSTSAIERQTANAEAPADKVKLTVSAGPSQTIQLPVDQAVLTSFVLPDSKNYKYSWELVYPLNQVDIGNIEGLNKDQVKVSHLKPGNYTFRVTVTGGDKPNDGGSATVGLTVLPPATAHHRPPIVVIEPNAQTVQLPNKDAVLDGSASRSPDAADGTTTIVRYDWAAIKVPIGYKNLLPLNSSILRLKDLTPGLYVFNLTVTDSRNATNSTTASVTVLKEADYPPVANAGPDIVVYLPQNSVTLNGSASTDDKGIESWQWSRADDGGGGSGGSGGSGSGGPGGGGGGGGSGSTAAVDMDGTSTAYLHLSNLQVGVYKFVLQVTDTSGQSSRAETHVFVKPESNEAPRADAGGDLELRLPLTPKSALLDGSKSADDIAIVRWEWLQIDVCQNDCSGHGSCDPYSRRCMCEAFWMENWLRVYFGDNQSNC
ncbi:PREDICTED: dyslexia-associated protein KIAA0319-like protein, partial [Rhagoletis zephyria]|uniref:dyslexia-associated protein KIAA0319-like protein n=1 Tax=Rhagoletis zephyria TaxID=28612 RepID=UPI0008114630